MSTMLIALQCILMGFLTSKAYPSDTVLGVGVIIGNAVLVGLYGIVKMDEGNLK